MSPFFKKSIAKEDADIQIISHSKLKTRNSATITRHNKTGKVSQAKCQCCGTVLHFPSDVVRFRCAVCQVTTTLSEGLSETKLLAPPSSDIQPLKLSILQELVRKCFLQGTEEKAADREARCEAFDPVSIYLTQGFHDARKLNQSFKPSRKHELIHYEELSQFYNLIMKLPTRRPFYRMLCASNDMMRKPDGSIDNFRWILIIWSNPTIRQSLTCRNKTGFESPQIRAVAYELAKRCVGYLSNLTTGPQLNMFIHYLKYMPIDIFQDQVETVNLYITFQLSRILYRTKKKSKNVKRPPGHLGGESDINDASFRIPNDDHTTLNDNKKDLWDLKTGKILSSQDFKFKTFEYERDWHIRCAIRLMLIYHTANERRENTLGCEFLGNSNFYNMMFDFIDYKQDFDNWRRYGKTGKLASSQFFTKWNSTEQRVALCSYPFLLTLGIKISIMEFEVRRIMEYEAEHAFLTSLDKGEMIAVYLKIRIRRNHITADSLRCIKNHQKDLMKSLRVEFVGEPGVDAGGLRKEWFLLLTRSLFNPMNGLFSYIEESRLAWIAIRPIQGGPLEEDPKHEELYHLFGIVVGLAIFNSTILDLQFPGAFYKKLCGEPPTFNDYLELYPETGGNLLKMLEYAPDDFTDVFGLTFETTFKDSNSTLAGKDDNIITVELCASGKNKQVTQENKHEFVKLWSEFYMTKSIAKQFEQFANGFHQVFAQSESIELFSSSELERLVCGDREKDCYDFQMLRSVTKYVNGFNDNSEVITWFWDIVQNWDLPLQRKLLQFISGSDRVPPTGMSTLPFKISRLGPHDSEKLPIAHTCFNELCLWDYSSRSKLEQKLWWAVTQCEGYGFR